MALTTIFTACAIGAGVMGGLGYMYWLLSQPDPKPQDDIIWDVEWHVHDHI